MTNDGIVDGMVHVLSEQVGRDRQWATMVIIATVCVAEELRKVVKPTDKGNNLARYEVAVKESVRSIIFIPVHIPAQSHWALIMVDFKITVPAA